MNIVTKIRFHLCLIKHLFSGLHKWGIANDPATEDERFTETCFVERFGRRRQSQPKTSAPSVISGANKKLVKIPVNSWIFTTQSCPEHGRKDAIRYMSIDKLTLAHFRYFSSLFTNLRAYKALYKCRESSTNRPFLCKTNPMSSMPKST